MSNILISIKPQYSQAIMRGEKLIEYRKRVGRDCEQWEKMLIYESAPTQRIVGYANVRGVTKARPKKLWDNTNSFGFINEEDYFKYFDDCDTAYGIQIVGVVKFNNPVPLAELGIQRAPQSWQNIDENTVQKAIRLGNG